MGKSVPAEGLPGRSGWLTPTGDNELGGRVHGIVLLEADGEVIDQGAHRRSKAALVREYDVDKSRLFVPIREKPHEASIE